MNHEKSLPPQEIKEMPTNEHIKATAEQLLDYSLEIKPGDVLLIKTAPGCASLCNEVISVLTQKNEQYKKLGQEVIQYRIQMVEPSIDKIVLEGVSQESFSLPNTVKDNDFSDRERQEAFFHYGPGSDELEALSESTHVLVLKERREVKGSYAIDQELQGGIGKMERILIDWRVKEKRWALIAIPTENSVRPEGMSFSDYEKFYYEACGRDWEKVEEAQWALVEKLTGDHEIKIEVPAPEGKGDFWKTSLTMRTINQIPVNSVARRNMPGSEVFLAPEINSTNGILAIPNPVFFKERMLPDLRLVFTNGKVTEFFCSGSDDDNAFIQSILDKDAGSSMLGELGIGTNPLVTIPVPDTLLAEKSFGIHLALGNSYDYKEYMGVSVNVDNGNRSAEHIDLPRIMTPEYGGGQIIIDGEVIFDNGKFLDPRLAILNGDLSS